MPFVPYATPQDLAAWLNSGGSLDVQTPSNVESYLRSATFLVASAINQTPYHTDASYVPDDALRDAACAQAVSWIVGAVDPAAGVTGLGPAVKAKAIGSASVTYDTPTSADREAALKGLAPDAWAILDSAGLLTTQFPLPQWTADPDPGFYVGETGNVQGGYVGAPLSEAPYYPFGVWTS